MLSSAWNIVSSCCFRRDWSQRWRQEGKPELGAEFEHTDDGEPTSPVEALLSLLPPFLPLALCKPSLPLPVEVVVSRRLFPLARSQPSPLSGSDAVFQLLCDSSAPPLLTALHFMFVAAAAGGRVRSAYYDRSGTELFLLPFFEDEGEEPVYLCVCDGWGTLGAGSLLSCGEDGSAPAERDLGRHLQRRTRSCLFGASDGNASGENLVLKGTPKPDTQRNHVSTTSSHDDAVENGTEASGDSAEGHGLAPEAPGAWPPIRERRTWVGHETGLAFEKEKGQQNPLSPQASAYPELSPVFRSGAAPFFGPPCPTCGGLSLRREAWEQILAAAAHHVGFPPQTATRLFEHVAEDMRNQFPSLSFSRSTSSSFRRSVKKEQHQLALRLLSVLASAARAAGAEVAAAAAQAAASSPANFCVIGAFSDKWLPRSFQVKEVVILPPSASLSIVQTRRSAGLFGITGDAFGLRNETTTTVRSAADALAADLALADGGPARGPSPGLPAGFSPLTDFPSVQRSLATMQRALDELQGMLPCQFVNQEQAFVCRARGVALGGLVAGVGPEAQKASDVVALQILQDLLVRLHVAPPHGLLTPSKPSILRQLTPDRLQQILLDCMRGVAAGLERPRAFACPPPAASSLAPGLLPLVSVPFSKALSWTALAAPTADVSGPILPSAMAKPARGEMPGRGSLNTAGAAFNSSTSGCAACVCVVHEASRRLLVCQVGDVTAVLARPTFVKTQALQEIHRGEGKEQDGDRATASSERPRRKDRKGRSTDEDRFSPPEGTPRQRGASGQTHGGKSSGDEGARGEDAAKMSRSRGRSTGKTNRPSAVSFVENGTSRCRSKSPLRSPAGAESDFFGLPGYCSAMDRETITTGFSFEAVVLTREHTLREAKECKRVINAGAVPLGHVEGASPSVPRGAENGARLDPPGASALVPDSTLEGSEEEADAGGRNPPSPLATREWSGGRDRRTSRGGTQNAGNPSLESKTRQLQHQLPHRRFLSEGPAALFLCPDTACPPLRCTRLLGMMAAQQYGVCSTPDVTSVNISKVSSFGFVLIASSVIWDLLEPQEAVDLVGHELRRQHVEALRSAHERRRRIRRQQHIFLRLARRNLHFSQEASLRLLDEREETKDKSRWGSSTSLSRGALRRALSSSVAELSAGGLYRSLNSQRAAPAVPSRQVSESGEFSSVPPRQVDEDGRRARDRSDNEGGERALPQPQLESQRSGERFSSGGPTSGQNTFLSEEAARGASSRASGTDGGKGDEAAREYLADSPELSFAHSSLRGSFASGRTGTLRRCLTREDSVLREVRGRVDAAAEASRRTAGAARVTAGLFREEGEVDESRAETFPIGLDFQAAATLVVQQFMEAWQVRREGLSMPDATVLVIPFQGPSRGSAARTWQETDSGRNRGEAQGTKKRTAKSPRRKGLEVR
uniref:Protein phosphatase 2C domain-containing protein n=1 Tax=Neospora caninum (strain Liverpool) TaxID=572307 RepID=A0A0F7UDB2_NEOCL|nr:TPA: protein phosphatase 2C domain-containing protein [Neospora caninum Liverpool]